MRRHTKDKPFKCEVCDKRFTRQTGLIIHTIIYNGKKPVDCDIYKIGFPAKVIFGGI